MQWKFKFSKLKRRSINFINFAVIVRQEAWDTGWTIIMKLFLLVFLRVAKSGRLPFSSHTAGPFITLFLLFHTLAPPETTFIPLSPPLIPPWSQNTISPSSCKVFYALYPLGSDLAEPVGCPGRSLHHELHSSARGRWGSLRVLCLCGDGPLLYNLVNAVSVQWNLPYETWLNYLKSCY